MGKRKQQFLQSYENRPRPYEVLKTIHAFPIDLDYAKISMIETKVMVTRMVYPRNYTLYGMAGLAILVQKVMRN